MESTYTNQTPRRLSLWAAMFWMSLALCLVLPLAAWIGYERHASLGAASAAIAVGVCWLGGAVGLAVLCVFDGLGNAVAGVLGSMLFRMGLPLGACVVIASSFPSLMQADFPLMIICVYLVTLVVETWLSLRMASLPSKKANVV